MKKILNHLKLIFNHKLFLLAIICSNLYTLGTQSDRYFGWTNPKNTKLENLTTIHTDGGGYYAYLPQWFIYQSNPHYSFLKVIYHKYEKQHFTACVNIEGKSKMDRNKCYTGTAVCIAPLFIVNHLINNFIYGYGDGYSKSYQFTIALSALFYWLLGILAIIKISKLLNINNFSIALTITLISIGTNLNFYTSFYSSFSHVYSFFAINWFLYFALAWARSTKNKYLILFSVFLGLIFIIRPINIVIALIIPFLFINWKTFILEIIKCFKFKKKIIIIACGIFLIPIIFHFSVKYYESGQLLINSYKNETFEFLFSPKIFNVLFSYRKGLFTYSPVLLLLIPGIYSLYKFNRFLFLGWCIVFSLFLYIVSSWWCWWYGGGFGMRPFIDFIGFISIPILILIDKISLFKKMILLIFTISMIYYYQILQYQYNHSILKYDNMSKDDYWSVFLNTDRRFEWMLAFNKYTIPQNKVKDLKKFHFNPSTFKWTMNTIYKKSYSIKQESPNPTFVFHPDPNWNNSEIGISCSSEIIISDPGSNPSIIYTFFKNGEIVNKQEQYIGNLIHKIGVAQTFSIDFLDSKTYSSCDSIEAFLTKGAPITKIKNLNLTFYSIKTN